MGKLSRPRSVYYLTVSVEAREVATVARKAALCVHVWVFLVSYLPRKCNAKEYIPGHLLYLPEMRLVDGLCPLIRRKTERDWLEQKKKTETLLFNLTKGKKKKYI